METIGICIRSLPPTATIHIVGTNIGWDRGLEYPDPDEEGRTALEVGPDTVGIDFKHFVLCGINERQQVLDAVKNSGYAVTGTGDMYGAKWRVWFLLADYPTFGEGVYTNNTFIK
ncbi:MAG: hypothetical protein BMS9Abin34_511 [Patescibacteria group bacterium]|nr:MAG: hypothetical protein BMS9Abin34_511 [Patescibacteria group bacterium]